jgi:hypothetical protein
MAITRFRESRITQGFPKENNLWNQIAYANPVPNMDLYLDADNRNSLTPNVHPNPTDLYAWVQAGTRSTLSRDNISSPVGNTPLKMVTTENDAFTDSYNLSQYNLAPAQNGETWSVSAYVKADANTNIELFIFGADSNSSPFGTDGEIKAQAFTATTEWQRFTYTITFTKNVSWIQIRLDGNDSGRTVWWDGVQVENTTPSVGATDFHPGPRTTWYDLSGNNRHLTLYNIPVSKVVSSTNPVKVLKFDGVDDYAESTNRFIQTSDNTTLMVFGRYHVFSGSAASNTMLTYGRDGFGAGWSHLIRANSTTDVTASNVYTSPSTAAFAAGVSSRSFNTSTYYNFAMVSNQGSNIKYYENGNLINTLNTTSTAFRTSTVGIHVSSSTLSALTVSNISVGAVLVYRRVLTDAEIKRNFDVFKTRFGYSYY